jgi:hypothetical protein
VGEALGRPLGRDQRVVLGPGVITGQREVVGQHRGVRVAVVLAFEPQPDRAVKLAPQLERQARVRHLLQRGAPEPHLPIGLAGEHR